MEAAWFGEKAALGGMRDMLKKECSDLQEQIKNKKE